jgi:iron(III) transport system ATP-binding protein
MPSIRLERLTKKFGGVTAVDDITVQFEEGVMTSLLGSSGCGKTTTLNLIAGFIEPDAGTIRFGDREIADPRLGISVPSNKRNLGMVFQSYALWPHLTVGENVAYGLKMRRVGRAKREELVRRALERVRLSSHLDRYPHELSGGQQQRVALARAIVYSPEILLFDEPLSNLDAQLREEMRFELKEVHRDIGVTAVYVTHDQAEAMVLSDRIIVMREGRIRQIGTPRQLYDEPADIGVAKFIGKANVVDAVVVEKRDNLTRVKIEGINGAFWCRAPDAAQIDNKGSLSIRPEGVRLQPLNGSDALTGCVSSATYLGHMNQYVVELGAAHRLAVESSTGEILSVGDKVAIEVDPERCYFICGQSQTALQS